MQITAAASTAVAAWSSPNMLAAHQRSIADKMSGLISGRHHDVGIAATDASWSISSVTGGVILMPSAFRETVVGVIAPR